MARSAGGLGLLAPRLPPSLLRLPRAAAGRSRVTWPYVSDVGGSLRGAVGCGARSMRRGAMGTRAEGPCLPPAGGSRCRIPTTAAPHRSPARSCDAGLLLGETLASASAGLPQRGAARERGHTDGAASSQRDVAPTLSVVAGSATEPSGAESQ